MQFHERTRELYNILKQKKSGNKQQQQQRIQTRMGREKGKAEYPIRTHEPYTHTHNARNYEPKKNLFTIFKY